MCGIAGFVETVPTLLPAERRAALEEMCRRITHRGPDDQGMFISDGQTQNFATHDGAQSLTTHNHSSSQNGANASNGSSKIEPPLSAFISESPSASVCESSPAVALGMRRLSIIDLAGGHQPIFNEDRSSLIVFNGEIYNFRELKSELEGRGHRFRTNCDTEAILHAYEEFGAECTKRLRGMFAFAIWDERRRELFLARDRAGEKPLYYALTKGGALVFGSELKSLLAHPEIEREINIEALDAFLTFGYVPDPLTIFQGVCKLSPAHQLTFRNGRIEIKPYWDYVFCDEADESRTESDCLEELRALLDEAVRVMLVADVPLGAFLSGGIDSSTVVGLMAHHARRTGAPPVKTFSIGFNEDSFNELRSARVAAEHFGTDHHEFIVTPDICRTVFDLVAHFDEPFADSSAIPTFMVSKLAREHVTVALSGDGGDELFAGYTRYAIDSGRSAYAHLPRILRQRIMQPLARRLSHGARGRNFLYNVALDRTARYVDSVCAFNALGRRALYTADFRHELARQQALETGEFGVAPVDMTPAAQRFERIAESAPTRDQLHRLLYLDSKTYLSGDILTKVDRMSMAASLETRAPLLDYKLIDFVSRLPSKLKMRGGETKAIMKQAVADLVPPRIINRAKQGFGVPLVEWINRELRDIVRDTLTDSRAQARPHLDLNYVNTLLDEHERRRRDHSTQLWTLFMLELWQRRYVDSHDFAAVKVSKRESLTVSESHEAAKVE